MGTFIIVFAPAPLVVVMSKLGAVGMFEVKSKIPSPVPPVLFSTVIEPVPFPPGTSGTCCEVVLGVELLSLVWPDVPDTFD